MTLYVTDRKTRQINAEQMLFLEPWCSGVLYGGRDKCGQR